MEIAETAAGWGGSWVADAEEEEEFVIFSAIGSRQSHQLWRR